MYVDGRVIEIEKEVKSQVKNEYLSNYRKEHYSSFSVRLPKDLFNELNIRLQKANMTKGEFIRKAMDEILKK